MSRALVEEVPRVLSPKAPPHNVEAEQSVLGAILLENHAIDRAVEMITPDDFYRESHRRIYMAMLDLAESAEPIDFITLPEILKRRNELEKIGGLSYLTLLLNTVPNAANIRYHCKIVREKAILQNLISSASDIITKAYMEPENIEAFLSETEGIISRIARAATTTSTTAPLRDMSAIADGSNKAKWVIEGVIPEALMTLLQAPKGHVKTWLALYFGICIASGNAAFPAYDMVGKPLSDGRTVMKRPVIYLDRENADIVLKPRLQRMGCPLGFKSWSYTQKPEPPRIDAPGAVDKWYLPLIEKSEPKPVLIFDTLKKFHSKDENSNTLMEPVMDEFKKLCSAGATVIILHHAGFPPKGDRLEKGRGAQIIGDSCDVEWMLDKVDGIKNSYNLRSPKNRLGEAETLSIKLTGNEHYMSFIDVGPIAECPF